MSKVTLAPPASAKPKPPKPEYTMREMDAQYEMQNIYAAANQNMFPTVENEDELKKDEDEGYDFANDTEPEGDLEGIDAQRS